MVKSLRNHLRKPTNEVGGRKVILMSESSKTHGPIAACRSKRKVSDASAPQNVKIRNAQEPDKMVKGVKLKNEREVEIFKWWQRSSRQSWSKPSLPNGFSLIFHAIWRWEDYQPYWEDLAELITAPEKCWNKYVWYFVKLASLSSGKLAIQKKGV